MYAQKSQLEDLNAYQNTNIPTPRRRAAADLAGLTVNAGIRLVDNGFTQQSLTQFSVATLTLPGNDRLVHRASAWAKVFANSTQTAIYYIRA